MGNPADKVQVLVAVDSAHLATMRQVAEACRAAGLDVERSLDSIGTITGAIEPSRMSELEKIPGVASVELAGGYDIGPPGAGVQ
jgi:hypothetical protein